MQHFISALMTLSTTSRKDVNTWEITAIYFKYQVLLKSAFWLIYDLGKPLRYQCTLWNNNFTNI